MGFWENLGSSLTEFFMNGLGGPGAQGIGTSIMVIGIVMAVISFAVHKFNPQSRMPGWFTSLLVGFAGSVLVGGLSQVMNMYNSVRDTLFSWMGL